MTAKNTVETVKTINSQLIRAMSAHLKHMSEQSNVSIGKTIEYRQFANTRERLVMLTDAMATLIVFLDNPRFVSQQETHWGVVSQHFADKQRLMNDWNLGDAQCPTGQALMSAFNNAQQVFAGLSL